MSDLLRPEVLFVSVILPICIAIRAWILVWFHNRWVDRDIARERAEKRKLEADRAAPQTSTASLLAFPAACCSASSALNATWPWSRKRLTIG